MLSPGYYCYEYQYMGRTYSDGLWAWSWEHAEARVAQVKRHRAHVTGKKVLSLYVWYVNNIMPWGGWPWGKR